MRRLITAEENRICDDSLLIHDDRVLPHVSVQVDFAPCSESTHATTQQKNVEVCVYVVLHVLQAPAAHRARADSADQLAGGALADVLTCYLCCLFLNR